MHIILAPDSYKDALSASEAVSAITDGIRRALPSAQYDACPMGDGGEGTLDGAGIPVISQLISNWLKRVVCST
jgi:glycerate kinase